MKEDKLSDLSMQLSVDVLNLAKELRHRKETIISNQIGRSGTSIGANIREAQYAHGKADFIAKLQIALKEANETGYWLELLYKTNYITENQYEDLDAICTGLRAMLIAYPLEDTTERINSILFYLAKQKPQFRYKRDCGFCYFMI